MATVVALAASLAHCTEATSPPAHPVFRFDVLWAPTGDRLEASAGPSAGGGASLTFSLDTPEPDQVSRQVVEHFRGSEWEAQTHEPGYPAQPTSLSTGWRTLSTNGIQQRPLEGQPVVLEQREWRGVWQNRRGETVRYDMVALRYASRPGFEIRGVASYEPPFP
jgi:hypothetical protein